MAKKKKVVEEVKKVELVPKEIIQPETLETPPVIEAEEEKPKKEILEFVEVIGIDLAEPLQKRGWQLVDCHQSPKGQVYKFKKGK